MMVWEAFVTLEVVDIAMVEVEEVVAAMQEKATTQKAKEVATKAMIKEAIKAKSTEVALRRVVMVEVAKGVNYFWGFLEYP